jgi:hypothetical protein
LRAAGDIAGALEVHRKALAVRRERAERHPGFIFVRWELTVSLNTVAELLLSASSPQPAEAAQLFEECRAIAERTLISAPSYTQVRKQLEIAIRGLNAARSARRFPDLTQTGQ